MVAEAPTKKRGRYACSRCGAVGHVARSKSCPIPPPPPEPLPPKTLWRCLVSDTCRALVWESERAMHVYDRHGAAMTPKQLALSFEAALPPTFDEGGDC